MCAEKITEDSCHALRDLNVFEDERVLRDLLSTEHLYVPHCNYFDDVQTDVKPFMRKMVTQWMVEVSQRDYNYRYVFPLRLSISPSNRVGYCLWTKFFAIYRSYMTKMKI